MQHAKLGRPGWNGFHTWWRQLAAVIVVLLAAESCWGNEPTETLRFVFGAGVRRPGYTQVEPATLFTAERGYGFEPGAEIAAVGVTDGKPEWASETPPPEDKAPSPQPSPKGRGRTEIPPTGCCTSDGPFFFSVALPDGNYRVTLTLGDPAGDSDTTVLAECRRLMREDVKTAKGQFATRTFVVNVHNAEIPGGRRVRLKPREQGILRWDDKLTFEFRGPRPCVSAMEIAPAGDDVVAVYIAGDSTVTDQIEAPWAGWGQILPRFFRGEGVAISNHAASGEALSSFVSARRWEKLLSTIRPGDYLLIQFGHNDMKQEGPDAGAFKNYTRLLKEFVATARERGATPVLVTPMNRLDFTDDGKVRNTLGDYPDAMRRVAHDEQVTLIDLNEMSRELYERLGPEATERLFVDQTHTNEAGAYGFARYIAERIKKSDLGLASHVIDDLPPADADSPAARE